MAYGKVHEQFWSDEKIIDLSDAAKVLAVYLISSQHRSICGAARVPIGYIMADLKWAESKALSAIGEIVRCGFATRDEATGWTHVPNQLRYDPPTSINHVKALIRAIDGVPRPMRADVLDAALRHMRTLDNAVGEAFILACERRSDAVQTPSERPSHGVRTPDSGPGTVSGPDSGPPPPPTVPVAAREPSEGAQSKGLPNGNGADHDPPGQTHSAGFFEFWLIYPLQQARGLAFRAYVDALNRRAVTHLQLIDGVKRYAEEMAGKPQFLTTAAKWIEGERWLDQPRPVVAATNGHAQHTDAQKRAERELGSAMEHWKQDGLIGPMPQCNDLSGPENVYLEALYRWSHGGEKGPKPQPPLAAVAH